MLTAAEVHIARYLLARGRRDEAIVILRDAKPATPNIDDAITIRALDACDAIDALGELATRDLPFAKAFEVARSLARRRRFDLLRPLIPLPLALDRETPWRTSPAIAGALAGLWPATPDDIVLIRDVLVPASATFPVERGQCAAMLGLLDDTTMAQVLIDELLAPHDLRTWLLACAAPAVAAIGGNASALVDEAYARTFDNDLEARAKEPIAVAAARVEHVGRLRSRPSQPWRPPRPDTFAYYLDAGDIAAIFSLLNTSPNLLITVVEHVGVFDEPQARDLARHARRRGDGVHVPIVIGALAGSGHIELANALFPLCTHKQASAEANAFIGAATDDRQRLEFALQDANHESPAIALARFVMADRIARAGLRESDRT